MKKLRARSFLLLVLAATMLFSACGKKDGSCSSKDQEKQETTLESTLKKAKACANTYDYDTAIQMLTSYDTDWESNKTLSNAVDSYQKEKEELVRVDASTVPHIFFHSLIADTDRAFDGDYDSSGYNQYMVTVKEFETILQQMYDNGYVLVSLYDVAPKVTFIDGTTKYKPGMLMLPKGKKPFVLSQDDVNYYEYMTDSDEDHIADKGGDGFASKLVIDKNGHPTCEYITADGDVVTGKYDLVPVLEEFIQEHPDFSYHGARAILGVTGYDGVLGYRTASKYKEILGSKAYDKEVKAAKKVAKCLKKHGYIICSHSFGHPAYGSISDDALARDCAQWEKEVQPIVGDTDILIYPYGSDIAGIEDYSGFKFQTLYDAGYRYFCNVDASTPAWLQVHDDYVRQGRINVDGYRMYYTPGILENLFDANAAFDSARPSPVPPI